MVCDLKVLPKLVEASEGYVCKYLLDVAILENKLSLKKGKRDESAECLRKG